MTPNQETFTVLKDYYSINDNLRLTRDTIRRIFNEAALPLPLSQIIQLRFKLNFSQGKCIISILSLERLIMQFYNNIVMNMVSHL
jgi:hypothetical protein